MEKKTETVFGTEPMKQLGKQSQENIVDPFNSNFPFFKSKIIYPSLLLYHL